MPETSPAVKWRVLDGQVEWGARRAEGSKPVPTCNGMERNHDRPANGGLSLQDGGYCQ